MLLDIVHTEDSLDLIGSLDRYVKIKPNVNDEEAIRSPKDYILDISELGEKIRALEGRNRLEKVRYILDEDLRVEPSIENAFEGINKEIEEKCTSVLDRTEEKRVNFYEFNFYFSVLLDADKTQAGSGSDTLPQPKLPDFQRIESYPSFQGSS
jgi:hypothetical protein